LAYREPERGSRSSGSQALRLTHREASLHGVDAPSIANKVRKMSDHNSEDYKVGYGRPPRHTQFKKGQSGNRRGRPKGTFNLARTLRKALLETATVNERGAKKRMTKLDVAVRQQTNKAAAGDGQALKLLAQLHRSASDGADTGQPIEIYITENEAKY